MRPVFCAMLILLSVCSAVAGSQVTVVLQFERLHSEHSILEMKAEAEALVKDAGVELGWRRREELSSSDAFPRLIVVTFRGACDANMPAPPLPPEPIALAYTYLSAGEPMPFADIECDRIRGWLRVSGGSAVFGRALGWVLAHGLNHILGGT